MHILPCSLYPIYISFHLEKLHTPLQGVWDTCPLSEWIQGFFFGGGWDILYMLRFMIYASFFFFFGLWTLDN